MKKILIVASVQSHIAQFHRPIIDMLKKQGYEVHVAGKDNLNEKNGLKIDNVDEIFNVSFERSPFHPINIKAFSLIRNIINNGNYDIVQCNTPIAGMVTRLASVKARKYGCIIIYTAHGFHFYKGASKKNWIIYYPIEKYMAKYCDRLVTINLEDYEFAKKKFNTDVRHIYGMGVNTNKYTLFSNEEIKDLKQQYNYQDNFIVLCVGELNKNKNQKTVISAINLLKDKIPNIKLLIAGNGSERKKLESYVEDLNLNNYVDFLGYTTELEKFVNISDIQVSASYREGLPFNIIEAMVINKPVVASINRGHKELIISGSTGDLFKPDNYRALANYIMDLYSNKDKYSNYIVNAALSSEKYKIDNVIKDIHEIYLD